MITIYKKTINSNRLTEMKKITKGCWINMISPTQDEIDDITDKLNIEKEYLIDSLDINESPRIEKEDDLIFILFKIPHISRPDMEFKTYPFGVILKKDVIVTICRYDNELVRDFVKERIKQFYTTKRVRFLLQLLLRSSYYYMRYLKRIETEISQIENRLSKRFSNINLMKLSMLEKGLLYFNTASVANDNVMKRIVSGKILPLYHEDQELLEDILIENKQAIEMITVYRKLITTLRETYSSMVSNNLNDVMKFLTAVTLVISIPTMIASFYGMNFEYIPLYHNQHGFVIVTVIALVLAIIIALWMKMKRYL